MVSRALLAGALAVLSSQAVIAGPCRPVSSIEASFSSTLIVSTSTEHVTSSTVSQSTETLETSLIVPTTDITTSVAISEATTATDSATTETIVIESETTITAVYAVPTPFKLRAQDGDAEGYALKSDGRQSRDSVGFGALPANFEDAAFKFDEETGHLQHGSNTLCIYYDDYRSAAQVRNCPSDVSGRYDYLTCEKPTSSKLTCRMPGKSCFNGPSHPFPICYSTDVEWTQFFVTRYFSGSFLFYFGDGDADDFGDQNLQPANVQLDKFYNMDPISP
ncbi:hypothetical protein FLONG3_4667 [Fusarium longipes]|uniref:Uncharacterized protein n=1 Tax=Fusarium longipes TaxID=694270 RepID=A0A395SYK0_9HYPO|nr:hypothetical protein FLONG3_4667 [Fusarium longipes]